MSINSIVFTGNCGADMEIRHTPKGVAIGTVNVAAKSGWGENQKTTWVRCKLFKERAEKLAPLLTKGTPVTVMGEFQLEEWTAKDGTQKSALSCNINSIQMQRKEPAVQQTAPVKQAAQADDFLNDDIPF